jgi:glyoxylase-like metal-dependent hydrolase (beta-lactamase superfamily II)
MSRNVPFDDSAVVDGVDDDGVYRIGPDIAYQRLSMVNVVFFGTPSADRRQPNWVLIDAGLPGMAGRITRAAERRFGERNAPTAIVLTHGHVDHVGALEELAAQWDVPVYAHDLELPFLNGTLAYPPPDSSIADGLRSLTSRFFSRGAVDVSPWLRTLPADGAVPGMPGWRWLHTPGHTAGHVSLWRPDDKTLIAGDAFITTKQESAYAVAMQPPELHGPPVYFAPDWENAGESVRRLSALAPELVLTGHGRPLQGHRMREALAALARDFERVAVPQPEHYAEAEERQHGR